MAGQQPVLRGHLRAAALLTALAASVLMTMPAHAFNLGQLTTFSALGEPLRLEFEVLDLRPADVDSFKVNIASPENYASRGLGYDSALEGLSLALVKTDNGRLVIRIEGKRPSAEPFVDLLLNISWASGATTRSVSVLLAPAPGTGLAVELPRAKASPEVLAAATADAPSAPVLAGPSSETPKPSGMAGPSPAVPVFAPSAPVMPPSAPGAVVVQPGDTAGALAARELPPGVSQSQYLLALAQVNPSAFIEGNVNRLQAGATLSLPTPAQAQATSALQAQQIITTQWQEFQAFRQQLATSSPTSAPERPVAEAKGKLESPRSSPDTSAPSDKLTLSKPTAQGDAKADQALLNERQANEADARLKELSRTMKELNQLKAQAGGAGAAPPSGTAAGSGPSSSSNSPTDAGLVPAADLPAPQPAPGASLIAQLADHPAVLPAAGGLLGLALAWLGLRLRRKTAEQDDETDARAVPLHEPLDDAVRLQAEPLPQPEPEPSRPNEADLKLDLDLDLDLDDEPKRGTPAQRRAKEISTP